MRVADECQQMNGACTGNKSPVGLVRAQSSCGNVLCCMPSTDAQLTLCTDSWQQAYCQSHIVDHASVNAYMPFNWNDLQFWRKPAAVTNPWSIT